MLPPERRLGRVMRLIEECKFFTLHAGRQTGKTTSLMWLERHFNASGRWRAVWVDIETARQQPDPARAMRTILDSFDHAITEGQPELARPDPSRFNALLVGLSDIRTNRKIGRSPRLAPLQLPRWRASLWFVSELVTKQDLAGATTLLRQDPPPGECRRREV